MLWFRDQGPLGQGEHAARLHRISIGPGAHGWQLPWSQELCTMTIEPAAPG